MMARALWGIGRSCSFLGVFVVIYQGKDELVWGPRSLPPVQSVVADGHSLILRKGSSTREEQRVEFHKKPVEEERGLLGFGLYNLPKSYRRGKGTILTYDCKCLAKGIVEKKGRTCNVRAATSPRVCVVWCQKTGLGPFSALRRDDSGGRGHGNGDGFLQGTRELTIRMSLTTTAPTRCHVRDCQKIIIPVSRARVKITFNTERHM